MTVLEKASQAERGGNTFFAGGGFRFPYDGLDTIRTLIPDLSDDEAARIDIGSYSAAQFRADLATVSDGLVDDAPGGHPRPRIVARDAMAARAGGRWVLMYGRQAHTVGDRLVFYGGLIMEAVGGGAGCPTGCSSRPRSAASTCATSTSSSGCAARACGWPARSCGRRRASRRSRPTPSSSRPRLRGEHGDAGSLPRPGWDLAKVRGSRFNTGDAIKAALDAGAQPFGNWSGAHAVAWDLNAPPTGNRGVGDLYQKHSYPTASSSTSTAAASSDEGADYRNYTYAKYGRAILQQPLRTAFQLFDQKSVPLLPDEYRVRYATKAEADTMPALAEMLGVDPGALTATVEEFNAACGGGEFNPLDAGRRAHGGDRSAQVQLGSPPGPAPYLGFAVTCGITSPSAGSRSTRAARRCWTRKTVPSPGSTRPGS